MVCSPASGSTLPMGPNTITCTATDDSHNSAEKTFTVTVVDTTPPNLTVPDGFSVEQTELGGALATWECSATDICDAEV